MNNNDLLKRFSNFVDYVNTKTEVQNLINNKNFLLNFRRTLANLKVRGKISESNIDIIMEELIAKINATYNTNYKYDGNYITTIDLIIDDIERIINKKLQDKFKEKAIDKLLEEVFESNE